MSRQATKWNGIKAIPDVLAVADVVVGSNDEDGVARFVRRHILNKK